MKEIALRIRVYGDPVLRIKAKKVSSVSDEEREILSAMARLMYDASGIGLASSQVGISKAMIVVDTGNGLYKLVNPRILKKSGAQALEEGCLSVPGVCIKIKRARKITVKAQDEFGKPVVIEAEDLLACVLQHEIDHLHGKLIADYASFVQRLKIKSKLDELRRISNREELSEPETKSCKLQL